MKLHKAILLTILYYIILELIGCWILLIPDEMEYLELFKISRLITSMITITFLVLIFKSFKQSDSLKFNKTDPKYYLISAMLGIGFVFFQSILNIIYHQEISSEFFDFNFNIKRLTSLNVIASILIVPIMEELFFRNYLLRRLLEKYGPIVAIIISSFLFAFIHIPFGALFSEMYDLSFHHAYITLFGGAISGILYYKSKSINPSIIFHMFWNLTIYVL